jgi:hypothetical protein
MTTIKYENSKNDPNSETKRITREAKLSEYLDLLGSSNDLIADKSSYEAFFFIGQSCFDYQKNELALFLEKNVAQIFTKTLASLFEQRGELNFKSETSKETGSEPIKSDDIRESIFSYTLYSINSLCRNLVRFEIVLFKLIFYKREKKNLTLPFLPSSD